MPRFNSTADALLRLKEQRDADYLQPWSPTASRTDAELLWDYINGLRNQLALKQDQDYLDSWKTNPDRMGGQFDANDYEQMRRAEQGIFG